METYLVKNTEINGLRIIGNNISELTEEALKYIWRNKDYYSKSIPTDLQIFGYSTISHFSTHSPNGIITIIHDEYDFFSNDDLRLSGSDLYKKITQYRLYKEDIEN